MYIDEAIETIEDTEIDWKPIGPSPETIELIDDIIEDLEAALEKRRRNESLQFMGYRAWRVPVEIDREELLNDIRRALLELK